MQCGGAVGDFAPEGHVGREGRVRGLGIKGGCTHTLGSFAQGVDSASRRHDTM